jgi:hypothetical protein
MAKTEGRAMSMFARFVVENEKLLREGALDRDYPPVERQLGRERWRRRHFIHPCSIFQAFVNALILSEPWGEAAGQEEFAKVTGLVRANVLIKYPEISEVSLAEVYGSFKEWVTAPAFAKWSEETNVDMQIVLLNTVLCLCEAAEKTEQEIASFEAEFEAEANSKKAS